MMYIDFKRVESALAKAYAEIQKSQKVNEKTRLRHLVIHCTATPEGRAVTEAEIRRWHTSPISQGGRGWKQVGYSDIISLDGDLVNLVPWNNNDEVDPWEITNGVRGINQNSRHIVYVGGTNSKGKPKDTRTEKQLITLTCYCRNAVKLWPHIKISGHYQHDSGKACPSFNVPDFLKSINIPEQNIFRK